MYDPTELTDFTELIDNLIVLILVTLQTEI